MGVEDLPEDASHPRLCHLVKRPDFSGYGFNLHAEKAKPGQYIGTVDPESPADLAGLKEGDRIVEVNGVNINQENHKQVVERIKSVDSETKLLVVDKPTEETYKRFSVVVKGTLPTVVTMTSLSPQQDDVMDFKEQQAQPPPLPDTPPPDEDEQDNMHSRIDTHSIETPSNDQGSAPTEGSQEGHSEHPKEVQQPLQQPLYEEEVQLTKNEIVVEVTIESSEEGSETKSIPDPDHKEQEHSRRESNDESVQSGSTASFKYAVPESNPSSSSHPNPEESTKDQEQNIPEQIPEQNPETPKVETTFADKFIEAPDTTSKDIPEDQESQEKPEVTVEEVKIEESQETQEIKPAEVKPIPFDRSVSPISSEKSTTVSESGSAASPMHSRSFSPASAVSSEPSHIKDSLDAADDHGNISRVNSTGSNWGGLNLNMTAKEMREMIGSKKKRDPRRDDSRLDFHKKYEIIQTL